MILRVVMLDTWSTQCSIENTGEALPYGRRLVSIELTQEQSEALKGRVVGIDRGEDRHEIIGDVWIETAAGEEVAK